MYRTQIIAIRESPVPNLRHRWGYGDTCENLATRESTLPISVTEGGDGDAREFLAIPERLLFYLCLPLGYDGLAILDVVAVFLVSRHSSGFGWFIHGKDTNKRVNNIKLA